MRDIFGSSILSNASWSAFHVAASKLVRFAAVAVCVRFVGSYSWGRVAATLVTMTFLYFLVDQGTGMLPQLHKVGRRSLDRELFAKITRYRLAMAALVVTGIQLYHRFIHPLDSLLLLYSFILIPRALNLDWWFQRRELLHLSMGIVTLRTAVYCGLVFVLLPIHRRPEWVVGLDLVAEAAGLAASYLLMRRIRGPAEAGPAELTYAALIRLSLPLALVGVLNTVHQSVDILFLKGMCGYEAVGEYDIGYRMGSFLFFLGAAVVQAIRPKLARLGEGGDLSRMGDMLSVCSGFLMFLGCCFLTASLNFSSPILQLLFGSSGELTRFVFQMVPLWVGLSFMTILCADTVLALGKRRSYLKGAILCAACNMVGNYLLIRGFGPKGSVFATVGAEAVFFAYSFFALPQEIRSKLAAPLGLQIAGYGAVTAAYFSMRWLGLPAVSAVICAAVPAALSLKVGLFRRRTFAFLVEN